MNNNGLTLNQLAERNAALVTEVEKLRAERVQLAAENAALKQYALDCVKEDQIHNDMETPATDAYLAGIKADGVKEFAAYQRAITEEWACKEGHSSLLKVAESAEIFAKQLREEAK